jgi:hypothetical protein
MNDHMTCGTACHFLTVVPLSVSCPVAWPVVLAARLRCLYTVLRTTKTVPTAAFLSIGPASTVDPVGLHPEPHSGQDTEEPTFFWLPR